MSKLRYRVRETAPGRWSAERLVFWFIWVDCEANYFGHTVPAVFFSQLEAEAFINKDAAERRELLKINKQTPRYYEFE